MIKVDALITFSTSRFPFQANTWKFLHYSILHFTLCADLINCPVFSVRAGGLTAEMVDQAMEGAGLASDLLEHSLTIGKGIANTLPTHRECQVHIKNECSNYMLCNPR